MHLWQYEKWVKHLGEAFDRNDTGLRVRYDKDVDPEVRRACKEFCAWLRREFFFPRRVNLCIRSKYYIMAWDGDLVFALFFGPNDMRDRPYGWVAAGDYEDLLNKWGKDNALAAILRSIAHELSHYFQWVNGIRLTPMGRERQATSYAQAILYEYAEIKEHP